jgi:hypothetical protein
MFTKRGLLGTMFALTLAGSAFAQPPMRHPHRPRHPRPEERQEINCSYGPLTCKSGYVWRDARDGDGVCVTPDERDRAHADNAMADSRRDPKGAYGPNSCISGFVWREAFEGDYVCVTPDQRDRVKEDNAATESRYACPHGTANPQAPQATTPGAPEPPQPVEEPR